MTFTDENVKEIIATGKPVVVDCWATWCAPCMALGPIVEDLAKEYEGKAIIGKYNVEDEGDLATDCGVRALPTILFFKNGEKAPIRLAGSQTRENLKAKIEELLTL